MHHRRFLALILVVGLLPTSLLLAQEERPQASPDDRNHAWFIFESGGQPRGIFHHWQEPSGDPAAPVRFVERAEAFFGPEVAVLQTEVYCRDRTLLSFVRGNCTVTQGQDSTEEEVTLAEGQIQLQVRERGRWERRRPVPTSGRVAALVTLCYLVEELPFDAAEPLVLDLWQAPEDQVRVGATLAYAGPSETDPPGGSGALALHRFDLTQPTFPEWTFWVDDEHRLQRVDLSDQEHLIRSTEEEARAAANAQRGIPATPR